MYAWNPFSVVSALTTNLAAQLPDGNARASSFSTFSSAKCLEILEMSQNVWKCWEMFPALKWGKEDHYLIFVPKLVAATTKPPQKGVKRENPFSVQTLSTA